MENENSEKKVVFILIIAVVILVAFTFIIVRSMSSSDGQEVSLNEEKVEDLDSLNEDESSISEYFEESFSEGDDLEIVNGDSGNLCEVDGEIVKEGTVKFGTTCVVKPTETE